MIATGRRWQSVNGLTDEVSFRITHALPGHTTPGSFFIAGGTP